MLAKTHPSVILSKMPDLPMRFPYPPACFDFQVKVWDYNTGKSIETLKVMSVATANKGAEEGLLGEARTHRAPYHAFGRESWVWPTPVPLPQMGNS